MEDGKETEREKNDVELENRRRAKKEKTLFLKKIGARGKGRLD